VLGFLKIGSHELFANLIYATIPRDKLCNYPHFMDEKLRFRHVEYLVCNYRNQLASKPALPLLFQRPHRIAGLMLNLGRVFLIHGRKRTGGK
jgi:hypothetical protein